MIVDQLPAPRKMLGRIGEIEKNVLVIERGLVHTTHRPLAGELEAAADATTARHCELPRVTDLLRGHLATRKRLVTDPRVVARHVRDEYRHAPDRRED